MPHPVPPPAVMLQATSSNAGKSVLATALCRIFLEDGLSVAPFKAQNMSLNSAVTPDGREIGRAQATQAAACRLRADARMNPVLLKPSSDTGSQVVVLGKATGTMPARDYYREKPRLWSTVTRAYDELAAGRDVMVLEGAGSPAEINLKAHDIVNMAMAAHARAAVLLIADIDRGGAFAHLVGTMELLPPEERSLVAGFVLNKFRGDPSLLAPALTDIEARTGVPFLGVVPFLPDLGLPEEDSVDFKAGATLGRQPTGDWDRVDIACVDLPHIANFTDLDALVGEPDASVRLVSQLEELGRPDALLLPGSKNTLADLAWLVDTGLARAIADLAARPDGPEVVGICGGYQMLGRRVADPYGVESDRSATEALCLLPLVTELARDKTLTRVRARHEPTACELTGYEIHHGVTTVADGGVLVCVRGEDGRELGHGQGRVWGTYVHGVFDEDVFRRTWLDGLRTRKGLAPLGEVVAPHDIEPALARLAAHARTHLDMAAIYGALGGRLPPRAASTSTASKKR